MAGAATITHILKIIGLGSMKRGIAFIGAGGAVAGGTAVKLIDKNK